MAERCGTGKVQTLSVKIPPIRQERAIFEIEGTSPLIVHPWTAKAKRELLDKHRKIARPPREAKDPDALYESMLFPVKGGYLQPAIWFKKAMVSACRLMQGVPMTEAKMLIHVFGLDGGNEIIVEGDPHRIEDMVRVGKGLNKTADVRIRAQFDSWRTKIMVLYHPIKLSAAQIASLLQESGTWNGVGERRPQTEGNTFGLYRIAKAEPVKATG